MFHFTAEVPANLHGFLVPLLAAWIDRQDHPLYRIETPQFGLVGFKRTPWPLQPLDQTMVEPAGEHDKAALEALSETF